MLSEELSAFRPRSCIALRRAINSEPEWGPRFFSPTCLPCFLYTGFAFDSKTRRDILSTPALPALSAGSFLGATELRLFAHILDTFVSRDGVRIAYQCRSQGRAPVRHLYSSRRKNCETR
jgi:hypothetical protein